VIAPFLPCYLVILAVGHRLLSTLANETAHMSGRTRNAHKEIIQGLLIQSCLPVVDFIAIGAYLMMQLQIVNAVSLGFATHMCGEFVVSINPLISLYFVRTYRLSV
ncbi:hypothetical protein PFISCL1PPCAC_12893, partial [Pristionchus fissidentatus]